MRFATGKEPSFAQGHQMLGVARGTVVMHHHDDGAPLLTIEPFKQVQHFDQMGYTQIRMKTGILMRSSRVRDSAVHGTVWSRQNRLFIVNSV